METNSLEVLYLGLCFNPENEFLPTLYLGPFESALINLIAVEAFSPSVFKKRTQAVAKYMYSYLDRVSVPRAEHFSCVSSLKRESRPTQSEIQCHFYHQMKIKAPSYAQFLSIYLHSASDAHPIPCTLISFHLQSYLSHRCEPSIYRSISAPLSLSLRQPADHDNAC